MMSYGLSNAIKMYPNTFDIDEIREGKGAFIEIKKDDRYSIKNAPLETYVKSQIKEQDSNMNVTSQEKIIIDGEEAIKIYGVCIGDIARNTFVQYLTISDGQPYFIAYGSDEENYDIYLPEFEQMVQTFKFRD